MPDKLRKFYVSRPWRELSFKLKIERGGKCERTGEIFTDMSKLIGHHKIPLTEDNVDDPTIALNPDNVEIISFKEHNKEHRRFGHKKRIYIVWGSPMSGKSTYVKQVMQYGDMVVDLDIIWYAISYQDMYIKPDPLRFNIFKLRDELYDQIKTRYGQFYDAYIISGLPDKYERERLSQTLGAELIYCESTREECLGRMEQSGKPKAWMEYINDWWERYNS